MAPKKVFSKLTTERSTREEVEHILVNLPICVDTLLFIENGTTLTWQQIRETFARNFKEDLED